MGDIGRSRREREEYYEVEELNEGSKSSRGSRFNLIVNQFGRRNIAPITGFKAIHPDDR